jgi:hypothetical protein
MFRIGRPRWALGHVGDSRFGGTTEHEANIMYDIIQQLTPAGFQARPITVAKPNDYPILRENKARRTATPSADDRLCGCWHDGILRHPYRHEYISRRYQEVNAVATNTRKRRFMI